MVFMFLKKTSENPRKNSPGQGTDLQHSTEELARHVFFIIFFTRTWSNLDTTVLQQHCFNHQ